MIHTSPILSPKKRLCRSAGKRREGSPVRAGGGRTLAGWILGVLWLAVLTAGPAQAQQENLLDRITNEKMVNFERRLEKDISAALDRYLARPQYVLSVRVIWDRNVLPVMESTALSPDKYKLPGFPIFVKSPSAMPEEGTPPFNRLVVKVLLDETLPEYYERFVRKLVPIVGRFVQSRGDQVVVLKETFPEAQKGKMASTLPEKELMDQLGEESKGSEPQLERAALPPGGAGMAAGMAAGMPAGIPAAGGGQMDPITLARIAYDEGRYTDSIKLVQGAFQKAVSNQERSVYLAMEGSVYYTLQNTQAALASWRRSQAYDPSNMEVAKLIQFLGAQSPTAPSSNQGGAR